MSRALHVVVVGEPAYGGLRSALIGAFEDIGCRVDTLDWGPWRFGLLSSAAFRVPSLGFGYRRQFRTYVDAMAEQRPVDLVLVVKGALLDGGCIEHLQVRLDSPVVCWNPDSPFDVTVSNRGAGIPEAIGFYDAYVTWAEDVADRIERRCRKVFVLPFAWDPYSTEPVKGDGIADGRIVFVGTGTRDRSTVLESLAAFKPLVYGNRWPTIEGIEVRPPVRGREMCKIIGEAKWNINLLRPQNALSHNMRSFEIVGAGGNQVAPYTLDHHRFFGDDPRTAQFRSLAELKSVLKSDPSERDIRSTQLLHGHTYRDRVVQLLDGLGIK